MDEELLHIESGVSGADESDDLLFTDAALEKIREIRRTGNVPDEYFVRLGSKSSGCLGMSYTINFDMEKNKDDREFELGDQIVVTDHKSLFYLMGVKVDFTDTEKGSGFVFHNPNNANVCGCSH
ncbi:MAG: HesB/IscA family protein [Candidatus Kapaibacterium sp.]